MKIIYTIDDADKPTSKSLDEKVTALSTRLTVYGAVTLKILVGLIIGFLVIYLFVLVLTSRYRVYAVTIPAKWAETGFNADAARDGLAGALADIQADSHFVSNYQFLTPDSKLDFTIPKTSMSFQTAVVWIKEIVGRQDILISADLAKVGDNIVIRPILSTPSNGVQYLASSQAATVPDALKLGALSLLSKLDPLVSGNYRVTQIERVCRPTGNCTLDQFAEAIEDLNSAVAISGESTNVDKNGRYKALLSLASVFSLCGEHETALEYINSAIQTDSHSVNAHEMKAVELQALRKPEEAIVELRRLLDESKSHDPSLQLLTNDAAAIVHLDIGNSMMDIANSRNGDERKAMFLQAIGEFDSGKHLSVHNKEIIARLGYAYYLADNEAQSVSILHLAVAADPRNSALHNDLANAVREKIKKTNPSYNCSSFAEAMREHEIAIALAHQQNHSIEEYRADLDLGKTKADCKDYDGAKQAIKASLHLNRHYFDAEITLGSLYWDRKKYDDLVWLLVSAAKDGDDSLAICRALKPHPVAVAQAKRVVMFCAKPESASLAPKD